jgi:hypothetical protein
LQNITNHFFLFHSTVISEDFISASEFSSFLQALLVKGKNLFARLFCYSAMVLRSYTLVLAPHLPGFTFSVVRKNSAIGLVSISQRYLQPAGLSSNSFENGSKSIGNASLSYGKYFRNIPL